MYFFVNTCDRGTGDHKLSENEPVSRGKLTSACACSWARPWHVFWPEAASTDDARRGRGFMCWKGGRKVGWELGYVFYSLGIRASFFVWIVSRRRRLVFVVLLLSRVLPCLWSSLPCKYLDRISCCRVPATVAWWNCKTQPCPEMASY